ncbi:MAG TPA: glycine zipper 2TM domain-containing protein [Alphaproteobacteria bacterium]
MQRKTRQITIITIAVIALVALSAGASALITRNTVAPEKPAAVHHTVKKETVNWNNAAAQPAPAPVPNCDDGNIVGALVGGAGGGVVGSQVGKGNGKTAATIAGALGGAYLGKEYIPTENVTCR